MKIVFLLELKIVLNTGLFYEYAAPLVLVLNILPCSAIFRLANAKKVKKPEVENASITDIVYIVYRNTVLFVK